VGYSPAWQSQLPSYFPQNARTIRLVNTLLDHLAGEFAHSIGRTHFVDTFAIGAGTVGLAFHSDHIHMNGEGYRQVLAVLLNGALNLLRRAPSHMHVLKCSVY
jgi:NAD(P)-dependent dehydrogenase (short-subunit alcohol dehydrogenase family)